MDGGDLESCDRVRQGLAGLRATRGVCKQQFDHTSIIKTILTRFPGGWLRVVVDFGEEPAWIVTAVVHDNDPRG